MLAAKWVVVLVSYHPMSCFISARRNSCLIRNTLQTSFIGQFRGMLFRAQKVHLFCSSEVEAGDKDATGQPEREGEDDGRCSKPVHSK